MITTPVLQKKDIAIHNIANEAMTLQLNDYKYKHNQHRQVPFLLTRFNF